MKKIFLSLFFCSICISNVYAGSHLLYNYQQLKSALLAGDDVVALVYLGRCKSNKAPVQVFTRFNFNVYNIYDSLEKDEFKSTIATSHSMLIEHPKYGFVRIYARIRVLGDNSVNIHTAFYDPKTYELKDASDYQCPIDEKSGISFINKSV